MLTKLIAITCLLAIVPTPITGQVNNWTQWTPFTACTATCGFTGTQFRTRVCIGGTGCPGLNRIEQICNRFPCMNGEWTQWTPFTVCSRTCGFDGTKFRTRVCIGSGICIGLPRDEMICNRQTCDIGQWANWTPFTACTTTCGFTGTHFRTRACIGGPNCPGLPRDEQPCNRNVCSNGPNQPNLPNQPTSADQWSNWTAWTACSATCGTSGLSFRTRDCLGRFNCPGLPHELNVCNRVVCPNQG